MESIGDHKIYVFPKTYFQKYVDIKSILVTYLISNKESFGILYRVTAKLLHKFPLLFSNPLTDFTKKPLSEYNDFLSISFFLSSEEKESTLLSICDF
jgi:hypothetical protein